MCEAESPIATVLPSSGSAPSSVSRLLHEPLRPVPLLDIILLDGVDSGFFFWDWSNDVVRLARSSFGTLILGNHTYAG